MWENKEIYQMVVTKRERHVFNTVAYDDDLRHLEKISISASIHINICWNILDIVYAFAMLNRSQ